MLFRVCIERTTEAGQPKAEVMFRTTTKILCKSQRTYLDPRHLLPDPYRTPFISLLHCLKPSPLRTLTISNANDTSIIAVRFANKDCHNFATLQHRDRNSTRYRSCRTAAQALLARPYRGSEVRCLCGHVDVNRLKMTIVQRKWMCRWRKDLNRRFVTVAMRPKIRIRNFHFLKVFGRG